jgi:hypothetical protein
VVTTPNRGDTNWDVSLNAALNDLQTQTTNNGTLITANTASIAALQPTNFGALESGYKAWTFPAEQVAGSGSIPAAGAVTLGRVMINSTQTVTSIALWINTVGSGLTSGQNFAGIYNSSGTLVATTADLTASWGASANWQQYALVGGPFNLGIGAYWVAVMSNGTTRPTLGRNANLLSGALYNGTLTNATLRFATNGTGTTALPSSITPSSNAALNVPYWFGLT